jgi:hypothetical protein
MRTATGAEGIGGRLGSREGLGALPRAQLAIVLLAALSLVLAVGTGLRGPTGLALLTGGGISSALLFMLGPAPRWPAALLVASSVALASLALARSALWIDVVL